MIAGELELSAARATMDVEVIVMRDYKVAIDPDCAPATADYPHLLEEPDADADEPVWCVYEAVGPDGEWEPADRFLTYGQAQERMEFLCIVAASWPDEPGG